MANKVSAPVDSEQNARTVREDTAELANYLLSDGSSQRHRAVLQRSRSSVHDIFPAAEPSDGGSIDGNQRSETIPEVSEPVTPEDQGMESEANSDAAGPSVLANLLKRLSPPEDEAEPGSKQPEARRQSNKPDTPKPNDSTPELRSATNAEATERTPLLGRTSVSSCSTDDLPDLESQSYKPGNQWLNKLKERGQDVESAVSHGFAVAVNPKRWNGNAILHNVVLDPASCLPAVAVGLLLNILDALSYGMYQPQPHQRRRHTTDTHLGMILFPLGTPLFSHLGSAGISIYYVSTIISQLVFSTGSIFKGAVGSELVSTTSTHSQFGPNSRCRSRSYPSFIIWLRRSWTL